MYCRSPIPLGGRVHANLSSGRSFSRSRSSLGRFREGRPQWYLSIGAPPGVVWSHSEISAWAPVRGTWRWAFTHVENRLWGNTSVGARRGISRCSVGVDLASLSNTQSRETDAGCQLSPRVDDDGTHRLMLGVTGPGGLVSVSSWRRMTVTTWLRLEQHPVSGTWRWVSAPTIFSNFELSFYVLMAYIHRLFDVKKKCFTQRQNFFIDAVYQIFKPETCFN